MCSRRARSDRNEENTLDAFAMQDAIGSGIKRAFLVSRGGAVCYMRVPSPVRQRCFGEVPI
jgi:hypothetical protein